MESRDFTTLLTVYLTQKSHSSNTTRFRDVVKALVFIISKPGVVVGGNQLCF